MGAMRPVRRMGLRLHNYRVCVVAGMTETLERYKLEIVNNHGDRYIRCEPAPDGSWVMFEDVAALQARVAELEAALRGLIPTALHYGGLRNCDHAALKEARAALERKKDE